MIDSKSSPERRELEKIFDEIIAEILERDRPGQARMPAEDLDPEVAGAVAALRAVFEGEHRITADLSFDQVYAKVLPHLTTIWYHTLRERGTPGDD